MPHSVRYTNYRYFADFGASSILGNTRYGLAHSQNQKFPVSDHYFQKIAERVLTSDVSIGNAMLFEKNYGIFINFFEGKNSFSFAKPYEISAFKSDADGVFGSTQELILIGDPSLK